MKKELDTFDVSLAAAILCLTAVVYAFTGSGR